MSNAQNIFSAQATTIGIAATATASTPALLPFSCGSLRIVNEGPNVAFVAVAASSTAATLPGAVPGATTCTPVLASSDVTLSIAGGPGGQAQYISAVCRAAGTAALSVSMGEGI